MGLAYASTFAGIEGFGCGFERAGMRCIFQCEINAHRRKVLAKYWPNVTRAEDIRDVAGSDLGRPDVLVGGFPCKHLSRGKAGRKGLASADDSGLYWEFQRLVDEHLRLVDSTRPRWAVLENVADLLSFNGGRDMAAVVLGLESLGYGWAYRVVDGRGFGSPQRRRRVLIVAHRGGDPRPARMVLADGEGGGQSLGLRGQPSGQDGAGGGRRLAPPGVTLARKSARPRAKASEGGYATWVDSDFFNVLTVNDGVRVDKHGVPHLAPVKQTHLVVQNGRLRTLTPVEWERLQGFPDNWTAGIDDAERLFALGDAMHVDMAEWLGRRLVAVDAALPMISPATLTA